MRAQQARPHPGGGRYLSTRCGIPPEAIAMIGDMPNDVLMFAHSGRSVAMGTPASRCSADADLYPGDDHTAVLADIAGSPAHDEQPKESR
jgi:phosphoglycolate phosphatase-like HAD superfamily hydrolase